MTPIAPLPSRELFFRLKIIHCVCVSLLQPPEVCSFQEAYYEVKVFTESNVMIAEIEWQKVPNPASVVEAEISSKLMAYKDYYAELIYQTHFATLRTTVAFSKC